LAGAQIAMEDCALRVRKRVAAKRKKGEDSFKAGEKVCERPGSSDQGKLE